MELSLLQIAVIVVIIAVGVTSRSYVPFRSKKKSGELHPLDSFDWHYAASAVWAFIMAVALNLATAYVLFKEFDVGAVENFILLAILAFFYGFGGTDFWNRFVAHFLKKGKANIPATT